MKTMTVRVIVLICWILFLVGMGVAAVEFKNSRAKAAKEKFDREMADAQKAFDKRVELIKKTYWNELNKALDDAMKKKDLAEATEIKSEMDGLDENMGMWCLGEWKNPLAKSVVLNRDGTVENVSITNVKTTGTWVLVGERIVINYSQFAVVFERLDNNRLKRISMQQPEFVMTRVK